MCMHLCECEYECVCVCTLSAGTWKDQKGTFDPLELELHKVMSDPTGLLGTNLCSSRKAASALN